eukprot:8889471-Pyramimonas_sp.AAC.2
MPGVPKQPEGRSSPTNQQACQKITRIYRSSKRTQTAQTAFTIIGRGIPGRCVRYFCSSHRRTVHACGVAFWQAVSA